MKEEPRKAASSRDANVDVEVDVVANATTAACPFCMFGCRRPERTRFVVGGGGRVCRAVSGCKILFFQEPVALFMMIVKFLVLFYVQVSRRINLAVIGR